MPLFTRIKRHLLKKRGLHGSYCLHGEIDHAALHAIRRWNDLEAALFKVAREVLERPESPEYRVPFQARIKDPPGLGYLLRHQTALL